MKFKGDDDDAERFIEIYFESCRIEDLLDIFSCKFMIKFIDVI